MNIPFLSFDKRNQLIRAEALDAFERFFDSNWYVLGNSTKKFEEAYASFCNTKFSVGVSTGLDAIHLALLALGIGKGDEVILPSNSYIATVLAVSYTGATPIFVEPKEETANLDPSLLEESITQKTKCIIPVHLYGQACEMDEIMAIADKHSVNVVEDNAQAHGATYNGKRTGSFGQINATSFYPTKNIGALGEAGAITTNDESLANKVSMLRNYGSQKRYYNEVIGYNNRIDEFEAAFILVVLKHIEAWNKERNLLENAYRFYLKNIEGLTLTELADKATTVNHLFVVKTEMRDELREFLSRNGIGTQIHYPIPPHLQDAYSHLGYRKGDFPIAEKLSRTSLSLPLYLGLGESQVRYICKKIENFFRQ